MSVGHSCKKRVGLRYILGVSHKDLRFFKRGVYSGREGYNLGGLHIYV